jgi:uncharacterized SAM-binding protein YcdF (DUF218 family)
LHAAGFLACACLAAWGMGWLIDGADEPRRADCIVVLAGRCSRPFFAADLFRRGLAAEVWMSRPRRLPAETRAAAMGVNFPSEEEVGRSILLKSGVPACAVRVYGGGVLSTAEEARAFARAFDARGKTVLIVTSRSHARRARMIFRRALPGARVLACATPYEGFTRLWWRDQDMAVAAILETAKTAFFLLGGRFLSVEPRGL